MSQPHLTLLGDATSVHVQRWAREMLAREWRVSLVTARPAVVEGLEQHVLRPVNHSRDWLSRVGEVKACVAALRPDIVHAHYVTSYGYLAARLPDVPRVMTAWGSDLLVTPRRNVALRWLTGWILRRATLITGDSADLVALAHRWAPGVPAELIHWGVDLDRFKPTPWADKPAAEAISLRSWEPNYQIDTVLRALAEIRRTRPDVRLHLLGGGSQEAELHALTSSLGLDDSVTFHGKLDDEGMAAVLARCKLSISVPLSDATSVSVLESMASGVAVLASDLPANRDWLAPEALMPGGDAQALAAHWLVMLNDDAAARRLAQDNAARIVRDGGRGAQMDAMDRLYRKILTNGSAA